MTLQAQDVNQGALKLAFCSYAGRQGSCESMHKTEYNTLQYSNCAALPFSPLTL